MYLKVSVFCVNFGVYFFEFFVYKKYNNNDVYSKTTNQQNLMFTNLSIYLCTWNLQTNKTYQLINTTGLRKTESFDDKKSNAGSTPMATGPRSVLSMRHSGDGDTTTQVPRLRFSSEKVLNPLVSIYTNFFARFVEKTPLTV